MAFAAMMARLRQAREGGSWHARLSLAQTGNWLWGMGRILNGLSIADLAAADIKPFVEETPSGFGKLSAVAHAAQLSATPPCWDRPAVPLGTDAAQWPRRVI
jgi:hypothetical protein